MGTEKTGADTVLFYPGAPPRASDESARLGEIKSRARSIADYFQLVTKLARVYGACTRARTWR